MQDKSLMLSNILNKLYIHHELTEKQQLLSNSNLFKNLDSCQQIYMPDQLPP